MPLVVPERDGPRLEDCISKSQSVIFIYQTTGQQTLCAAYIILSLKAYTATMNHLLSAFSLVCLSMKILGVFQAAGLHSILL